MAPPVPPEESLTVEFKSDQSCLPDSELVATVVCLTNTEGGDIYLGVENTGEVTGLHERHPSVTGLAAMIANRTHPAVSVRASLIEVKGRRVARIEVPKARSIVSTSEGLTQRRRLTAAGEPECVPFYPHEQVGRHADLGSLDVSFTSVPEASVADFDSLERNRLRQAIQRYGGDRSLLALSDDEFDGALGFVRREEGILRPTVTGLLFLGSETALSAFLPTHEVAFQLMMGTDVRANDFYRLPLLRAFERIIDQVSVRIVESEIQVGLFRVPVPNYDLGALREAFVNALVHRDYTRLGAVHVRWESDRVVISNPGAFVEGVSTRNILVTEPRPRNPRLADVAKRIGLAERTGRGVDLIYRGLLRYGRPAPGYLRSDATSVVVELSGGDADPGLLRLVIEEEARRGDALPIDTLIALAQLWRERRLDTPQLAAAIQRDESAARAALEQLVEADLVEAHGVRKGRTYTLSARVYREFGLAGEYVRQAGFDPIQQEQMVRTYVRTHGRVVRSQVVDLCKIGDFQATRLLQRMTESGILVRQGERKGAFYVPGPNI